jgi:hypothetical protein
MNGKGVEAMDDRLWKEVPVRRSVPESHPP